MTVNLLRAAVCFALVLTMAFSLVMPLFAQNQDFAHKHPTMTAIAAGAGTTYMLKRSAKYKKEHGEKLNFADRHPYFAGTGVALITHHVLAKKHHQ